MKVCLTSLLWLLLLHTAVMGKTYDILTYGAEADGKTINTKAIQKAIDACTPGDTVYVQTGRYLTGTLHLKSNITFFISKEGFLIGSRNLTDYEAYSPVNNANRYGMLMAVNATNINITGPGTIEGNGAAFTSTMARPVQIMRFLGCNGITVQNLSVLNTPFNGIELTSCQNTRLLNLKLQSELNITATKGIVVKNCINTLINGCYVNSARTAVVFTGMCNHITLSNCALQSPAGALKITVADSGYVNNVKISHVNIINSGRGISLEAGHRGTLENMTFSDIYIETHQPANDTLVHAEPLYIAITSPADSLTPGTIKNITFNNILGNAENYISLSGTTQSLLQDVRFDNLVLTLKNGAFKNSAANTPAFAASYVSGLSINNIAINWPQGQSHFTNGIVVSHFNNIKITNYAITATPAITNAHAVLITDGAIAMVDAGDVLRVRVTEPKVMLTTPKTTRKKAGGAKATAKLP